MLRFWQQLGTSLKYPTVYTASHACESAALAIVSCMVYTCRVANPNTVALHTAPYQALRLVELVFPIENRWFARVAGKFAISH